MFRSVNSIVTAPARTGKDSIRRIILCGLMRLFESIKGMSGGTGTSCSVVTNF